MFNNPMTSKNNIISEKSQKKKNYSNNNKTNKIKFEYPLIIRAYALIFKQSQKKKGKTEKLIKINLKGEEGRTWTRTRTNKSFIVVSRHFQPYKIYQSLDQYP